MAVLATLTIAFIVVAVITVWCCVRMSGLWSERERRERALFWQNYVLEFVRGHPWTNAREVSRELGLGLGAAQYNLDALTGGDLIVLDNSGRYWARR